MHAHEDIAMAGPAGLRGKAVHRRAADPLAAGTGGHDDPGRLDLVLLDVEPPFPVTGDAPVLDEGVGPHGAIPPPLGDRLCGHGELRPPAPHNGLRGGGRPARHRDGVGVGEREELPA
ncbi:hypothetical protein OG878_25565 [Streptomyces sp. NBC_00316]|nr:hypothetical protein [Streptomyces sp. NBC_00316]